MLFDQIALHRKGFFMIDVTNETLILPTEASKILPKQKGKKLNVSTVYRWMQTGLRGHRLEFICIGGTRFTSHEALNRFFHRVTDATTGNTSTTQRSNAKSAKQAADELDKIGL